MDKKEVARLNGIFKTIHQEKFDEMITTGIPNPHIVQDETGLYHYLTRQELRRWERMKKKKKIKLR